MPHMLKCGMVLYASHVVFWLGCTSSGIAVISTLVIVVIIITTLVGEVCRSLVFVCAAIVLKSAYYIVDVVR